MFEILCLYVGSSRPAYWEVKGRERFLKISHKFGGQEMSLILIVKWSMNRDDHAILLALEDDDSSSPLNDKSFLQCIYGYKGKLIITRRDFRHSLRYMHMYLKLSFSPHKIFYLFSHPCSHTKVVLHGKTVLHKNYCQNILQSLFV